MKNDEDVGHYNTLYPQREEQGTTVTRQVEEITKLKGTVEEWKRKAQGHEKCAGTIDGLQRKVQTMVSREKYDEQAQKVSSLTTVSIPKLDNQVKELTQSVEAWKQKAETATSQHAGCVGTIQALNQRLQGKVLKSDYDLLNEAYGQLETEKNQLAEAHGACADKVVKPVYDAVEAQKNQVMEAHNLCGEKVSREAQNAVVEAHSHCAEKVDKDVYEALKNNLEQLQTLHSQCPPPVAETPSRGVTARMGGLGFQTPSRQGLSDILHSPRSAQAIDRRVSIDSLISEQQSPRSMLPPQPASGDGSQRPRLERTLSNNSTGSESSFIGTSQLERLPSYQGRTEMRPQQHEMMNFGAPPAGTPINLAGIMQRQQRQQQQFGGFVPPPPAAPQGFGQPGAQQGGFIEQAVVGHSGQGHVAAGLSGGNAQAGAGQSGPGAGAQIRYEFLIRGTPTDSRVANKSVDLSVSKSVERKLEVSQFDFLYKSVS
jgi:hypothetical protein